MRTVLEHVGLPQHLALAYDAWAPVAAGGKVPQNERTGWLEKLERIAISADYVAAFERWESSFNQAGDRVARVKLKSRLLVGHGNSSATDVGLSVHHTWGVPFIPGAALKGLVAHYLDAVYGPEDGVAGDPMRAPYQGVIWRGRRVERGPGDIYRKLFGAPGADDDDGGATAGAVLFHDALYVPGSATDDRPFATDVLTVHQKEQYYDKAGGDWPNDYEDPVPIQFLSVRPGVQMLLALSGPAICTEFAEKLLIDALGEWGSGGKTSSGYGRFAVAATTEATSAEHASLGASAPTGPRYVRGQKITVTRVEAPGGKVRFQASDSLLGHFAGENPPAIDVGAAIDVWVANSSPQGYTLTLRQPREHRR